MPYIYKSDLKLGMLVLYQDTVSLEPKVCIVTKIGGNWGDDWVEVAMPDGITRRISYHYLRRVPA